MQDRVRVMVVDDSPSTRTMLREALALDGGIEVVGEAGGGREAVQLVTELEPDVVLMDVRMPDGDGVNAARKITNDQPTTKIVALTWSDDPATVRDMLTAGAIGYVVKGGTIDELCSAIRRASSGEPELDQRVLPAAMEDLRRLLEEERERREQEASVVESALRRADELQFLVEGLELVGSGPSADGSANPREAIRAAAQRVRANPDGVTVEEELWQGLPQPYLERV